MLFVCLGVCVEFIGFRLSVAVPFKGQSDKAAKRQAPTLQSAKIALHSTLT
jgi:hypothetical protein